MRNTVNEWLNRWRRRHWRASETQDRYRGLEPVVCITGGSDGIGLALAQQFARDGHALLLVARDPSRLEMARRKIVREVPEAVVHLHHVDLRDAENRRGLEAHAATLGFYVDVLVNAAGSGLSGPFLSHSAPNIDDLITLNMTALTDLCRKLLPGMMVRGRGGILNVSSLAGEVPGPFQAAYYASKSYVTSLGAALAHEMSGHGVRITTLAPGAVDTTFHDRMGAEGSFYLVAFGRQSPVKVAEAGYRGFLRWRRFVVPGIVHKFNALALHLAPDVIAVPFMGFLLRRRGDGLERIAPDASGDDDGDGPDDASRQEPVQQEGA
ncbi:MAG: SDR family oxidoreductase [Pseudomonadota bacterium]